MKKAIAIFQRKGSQWNPDKPVREQAYWDEHARFVDALFDPARLSWQAPLRTGVVRW